MTRPQSFYRNQILHALAPEDFAGLAPFLEPVRLNYRLNLETAGEPIERVCFPETGIVSVVATSEGLSSIEVGLIGWEGMSGLAIVMGATQSPQNTYVQVQGSGHLVEAKALATLLDRHPAMRKLMLGYAHVFTCQVAQTALVNGGANIKARLARLLLMASDRLDNAEMPLTHELLAIMLGVRRPGVTDTLHLLEGQLLIKARRGAVTIRDRAGLEAVAGGAYGVPEQEYRRTLGMGTSALNAVRSQGSPTAARSPG